MHLTFSKRAVKEIKIWRTFIHYMQISNFSNSICVFLEKGSQNLVIIIQYIEISFVFSWNKSLALPKVMGSRSVSTI